MNPPVLWHFRGSHFNEKVRWALDFKAIPHLRRTLGASYLPRALWKTRQPTLPVLLLDGRGIADSTRIIETLERLQPEPALYPHDPAEQRRALDLEADELQPSGYLVGQRFSVADLTAAALLGVLAVPGALEYAPPAHTPASLAELQQLVSRHVAGKWAADMYRLHRGKSAEIAPGR